LTRTAGVILAGGLGRRMGGADKGLVEYRGRPLVAYAAERLRPQVDELFLNANRNAGQYAAFGAKVIADRDGAFLGPLAGLSAALHATACELVVSVPCDSPDLPEDLVGRLAEGLRSAGADVAVAQAAGRLHPVFCLCRREVLAALDQYLAQGGRRVEEWVRSRNWTAVAFEDQPEAFRNLNTAEDLQP
jgi:molybdopterin-guanine dinucleotide biosynthesis protein A